MNKNKIPINHFRPGKVARAFFSVILLVGVLLASFAPNAVNLVSRIDIWEPSIALAGPLAGQVTKDVDLDEADPGETLTYTITVGYDGPELLSSVTVTDAVPTDTTYVPGSANAGGIHDGGTPGVLTWSLGNNTGAQPGAVSAGYLCVDTVILPASQDTFIEEDDQGADNSAEKDLLTRVESSKVKRALYQFNLSQIPSGATVNSAILNVYVQATRDEQVVDIKRIITPWTDSANWTTPWTSSGGDFHSYVYDTIDPSSGGYQEADVTTLVSGWANGTLDDFGLILDPRYLGSGGYGDAKFRSMEEAGQEPYIEVAYEYVDPIGCLQTLRVDASQDTYIEQDDQAADNSAQTDLFARVESSKIKRPLYQFDFSQLPSGAQVNSATLNVYVQATRDELDVDIKRITTSWTDTANWTTPWASSGGDFNSYVYNTIDPSNGGYQQADLTTLVRGWVTGTLENYGLILDPRYLGTGGYGDAKFRSMEEAGQEPYIEIIYRSPTVFRTLSATQDTYIEQDDQGADNSTQTDLETRVEPTKINRPLYQFDLSQVPSGAIVNSATLNVFVHETRDEQDVDIKRVTTSWIDSANWTTPWTSSGGDFDSYVYDTIDPSNSGYQQADLSTLVQGWVTGTLDNNGLLLDPRYLGVGGYGDAKFRSMEEDGEEPYIEVDFEAPVAFIALYNSMDANPRLLTSGETINVTMNLTATEDIPGVSPNNFTLIPTNGVSATCTGPTPASQTVYSDSTATFTWSCTSSDSGSIGGLSFSAEASDGGSNTWAVATSNSVIITPALTFQVQIEMDAESPVANIAYLHNPGKIPTTPSNEVTTTVHSPKSVTLMDFTADYGDGAVQVNWETTSEIDTLGFNLFRADTLHGQRMRLNQDLIHSQVLGSLYGTDYTWLDETVEQDATYYYWLEVVEVSGGSRVHGPVGANTISSPPKTIYRVFLPALNR